MWKVTEADPRLDRQLDGFGPMLLWRDGPGGRREGLLLLTEVCPWPGCPDRHLFVEGYRVDPTLLSVELVPEGIRTAHEGTLPPPLRGAFHLSVGLEAGELGVQRGPAPDAEAAAWFERALDAELLEALRRRFERARGEADRGTLPYMSSLRRPGRNDPCPCGSGKKHKRCCLGGAPAAGGLREVRRWIGE